MTIYEDSRLIRLWRNWLSTQAQMPLDKWLAQQLRELATVKSHSTRKGAVAPAGLNLADQASLSAAMRDGVRFQQFACAMEFLYQEFARDQREPAVDWQAWDKRWQALELHDLSTPAFWYWIQLRVTGDPAKSNRAQLPDAAGRSIFFSTLTQRNYFARDGAQCVWMGLRPNWQPLLEERQKRSDWSHEQFQLFLQMQTTTPPLWLRINSDKSADDICQQLVAQGVDAHMDPTGEIYATGGKGVATTDHYKNGVVEIQDLASQLIAAAVAVEPGQKVWDACAGAGGKTLAIAARMNNKGALVATDLHNYKLEELKRRVKRAGAFNVRSFSWAGEEPLRLPKEIAQQQGFDWVLVDAPCTSSGTWRRNPDARWRFDEQDSQELVALQRKILRNVAAAVRPQHGKLVYATCSWQISENEAQVEWFLREHPQFHLQSQRIMGAPDLDSDVMFVAVLAHRGN